MLPPLCSSLLIERRNLRAFTASAPMNVARTVGIWLIANQLAAITLDFRAGPPRQEQIRRVTLEVQPDKPGAADLTTPEDTARTHVGAAAFGCQGVRRGDKELSNLTLRHCVSGAKERSYRRDQHQGVCTHAALRLRPWTLRHLLGMVPDREQERPPLENRTSTPNQSSTRHNVYYVPALWPPQESTPVPVIVPVRAHVIRPVTVG
mmetsp:Transcript_9469/g.16273  ORF Transcript_9469/g.16273 Transcript_9469/m.16273 type:complete len:206 (-) Transcript_9469:1813-2430(-)